MAKKKVKKAKKSKKKVKKKVVAKKAARRGVAKKSAKKKAKKKASRTVKKKAVKKAAKKTAKKKTAKKTAKKVVKKSAKKDSKAAPKKSASGSASGKSLPKVGTTIKDYVLPATMPAAPDTTPGLFDPPPRSLRDLSGPAGIVLYFYPKDNTPGCTVQACDFRDNLARLKATGFNPVGVSADNMRSHERFTERQSLNFPLISDENKTMLTELGLWVEKKLYGRSFMGIPRTTLVLDKDLKVLRVYEKVKPQGHVDLVMADIATL